MLHDLGPAANKIGLPEVKLGIIPGAGGTQRAARLLGLPKAKDLIFTGRMLNAVQALEWGGCSHVSSRSSSYSLIPTGVVDYVAEGPQSAYDRALQLAKDMSGSAPLALRAAKRAISRAPEFTSIDDALDFERECYEPLLASQDRVEALNAFKEKRAPVFKGE